MTTLLAASTGGHLAQLISLRERLPWDTSERLWVTFDTEQSRSALAGEDVVFVRHAGPREVGPAMANLRTMRDLVRSRRFEHAVSTGASLAVSVLPVAANAGARAHYVESAARVDGPSLSGRILRAVPRVATYTQHDRWSSDGWPYAGCVFDSYAPTAMSEPRPLRRVVVTLGAQRDWPFRSLVQRLVELLPNDIEVLWQTGSTDCSGLGVDGHVSLPFRELEAAIAEADLVVAHAGVGSALTALEHGTCPVLVPRRASHHEHVDDHQLQIARLLADRGLAVSAPVDQLERGHLDQALGSAAQKVVAPPPLSLPWR